MVVRSATLVSAQTGFFSTKTLRQSNIGNTDAGMYDRNLMTSMKAGENIPQIKITLFSTTNTKNYINHSDRM